MAATSTPSVAETRSPSTTTFQSHWLGALVVAVATAAALIPFLDRPVHIDDTVFLVIAEQILEDPLHPYNFDYNWDVRPRSMWETTQHPPLHSYLLALVGLAADMREGTLHLAYLGLAVGCALLMHSIARRMCSTPLVATLLSIATPAFLVSACTLMADVPLLFFWLLSVRAAIAYADTSRPRWIWLACLSATAAAMTKYFGIALVPLLVVYCIPRDHRSPGHLLALALPVLTLFVWGVYAEEQSGIFHPLGAVTSSINLKMSFTGVLRTLAQSLSYLGATVFWPILLIPFAFRLRWWQWGGAMLLAAAAVAIEWRAETAEPVSVGVDAWILSSFAVASLGGAVLLVVCASSWLSQIDSDSSLLGLWFFGTMAFVAFCNWTVNARVILPCVLPAAILTLRWLERLDLPAPWAWWPRAAFLPTFVVAFVVALADERYAEANKTFAETTAAELIADGGRVLFTGHWGFQYYMERAGAMAIDHTGQIVKPGDYVVYPQFNCFAEPLTVPVVKVDDVQFPNPLVIHTMSPDARAGFYTSGHACLPFFFCPECPADRFTVYQIVAQNRADSARRRPGGN